MDISLIYVARLIAYLIRFGKISPTFNVTRSIILNQNTLLGNWLTLLGNSHTLVGLNHDFSYYY